eukprot:g4305.t1
MKLTSAILVYAVLVTFIYPTNGRELLQQRDSFINLKTTSWSGVITGDSDGAYSPCNYVSVSSFNNSVIQDSGVAFPVGYFPLEKGELSSWPFPLDPNHSIPRVSSIEDEVFGEVMDCSKDKPIILPSMNYTSSDQWSIAFWFKSPALNKDTPLFVHGSPSGSSSPSIEIFISAEEDQLKIQIHNGRHTEKGIASFDGDQALAEFEEGVQNNQWHFATLISRPNKEGYQLYLNGVIVIQSFQQEEQIKTPNLKLDDQIQLCPTSFNGSLAHLLLFDQALTRDEIQTLYSTFFTSKAQLTGPASNTTQLTQNGEKCFFPALFRGTIIDECIPINGSLHCPSTAGHWSLCSSLHTVVNQPIDSVPIHTLDLDTGQVIRYSTSGKRCNPSAFYLGKLVFGCVEIDGVDRCLVGDGVWEPCSTESSPKNTTKDLVSNNRTSINGKSCVFPFEYNGESYNDCTFLESGSFICRVATGEILPCAVEQRVLAGGPMINSRLTVHNNECFFPLWYNNRSVGECIPEEESYSCLTASGEEEVCKSQRFSVDGYPCVFPFPYSGTTALDCVEVDGIAKCKTADGVMRNCAPAESVVELQSDKTNSSLTTLPGRITVSGELCHFPFWYEGTLHDNCVTRSVEDTQGVCRNIHGEYEQCYPQRFTVDREPCSIPYYLENEPYYDCVKAANGTHYCPTVDGNYHTCDLSDGVPMFELSIPSVPELVVGDETDLEEILELDVE